MIRNVKWNHDPRRRRVAVFVVVIAVAFLLIFSNKIFFENPRESFAANWPRLIWTISLGLGGFALTAFNASFDFHDESFDKESTFYVWYTLRYLVSVIGPASVAFIIFNLLDSTRDGETYYIVSGITSFIAGYIADPELKSLLSLGFPSRG